MLTDFESLYRDHSREVFRFCCWLSGDRSLAEDLTSETFVRAWTARERVEVATLRGYLLAIARNLYLDVATRSRRAVAIDDAADDPRPGPHERAEGRAELQAVQADLLALPEVDRAALLLRAQEGLAYAEIAAALGISVGAAKVKVHRARARLAEERLSRARLGTGGRT